MAQRKKASKKKSTKRVTRYTYADIQEPSQPETGHTPLLPAEEQVVSLPMDNGWSRALEVGKLPHEDRPVVVDMDPAADPVLFWAGKRNRREVPLLPLQRNEIVTESRIAQIIERATRAAEEKPGTQRSLFAGLEKELRDSDRKKRVEFYTHDEGWKNKLICGDSLHVMESLLHYEGLCGKVQVIYVDPPYGIGYSSNFQQRVDSTQNEDRERADDVLTIRAFRDAWSLGVHSYLGYLAERLYLARELLRDSGSVFVQISDSQMHLVRALLDEVFGAENRLGIINYVTTSGQTSELLATQTDYLLWYAKHRSSIQFNRLYRVREPLGDGTSGYSWIQTSSGEKRRIGSLGPAGLRNTLEAGGELFMLGDLTSQRQGRPSGPGSAMHFAVEYEGRSFEPTSGRGWSTTADGIECLRRKGRLAVAGNTLRYIRYLTDFPCIEFGNNWQDTGVAGFARDKVYSVQTNQKVVERCLLMTTRPGDLVFDPTCGSGTTAYCAEKLGRRWITCDTSRVAINVARKRILSSTFEHYKTRDRAVSSGFIYKTVDRVTLRSLAYDLEPEKVELVDQPTVDRDAIRVCGPIELMTLGRYSVEDWKGYVVREAADGEAAKLENYIETICRLYRKDAAIQGSSGLVHAVSEGEDEKIAISVGPLSGRVTAKQIHDAVQDAMASGMLEVHVLGWAFEANVGEMKSTLEKRGKVKIELIMIRPDTLAEGLKVTQPDMLFSPLALPDIEVVVEIGGKEQQLRVKLQGVALFDRKRRTTEYKPADSGYVSAWYLDEDYDGDCFVDCQMFFDFKKTPNIKAALKADVDPGEFTLRLESEPFPLRGYKRIAVKVVDVYGNESTVVRELA